MSKLERILSHGTGRVLYSRVGVLEGGAALDSVLTALREVPVTGDDVTDPSGGREAVSG